MEDRITVNFTNGVRFCFDTLDSTHYNYIVDECVDIAKHEDHAAGHILVNGKYAHSVQAIITGGFVGIYVDEMPVRGYMLAI